MPRPRALDVDLEKVKQIYYTQTSSLPTCLTEVCDTMGIDYFRLIEHIRELSRKEGSLVLTPHVLPPGFSQQKRACIGEILFDYRMLTSYSYDVIAIMFGYDNKSNVHRAIRRARFFGMAEPKRIFPEALTVEWQPNAISRSIPFSTFELNKALHDSAKDVMHIPARRLPGSGITKKIEIYRPVYDVVVSACQRLNINMNDFISSAVVRFCV